VFFFYNRAAVVDARAFAQIVVGIERIEFGRKTLRIDGDATADADMGIAVQKTAGQLMGADLTPV
jgi:hypothetical protein